MTFKQRAQELLQSLPEELTAHDLEVEMAKLIQKLKIEEGLEASTNGQTVSHEEVTQRMARWLYVNLPTGRQSVSYPRNPDPPPT